MPVAALDATRLVPHPSATLVVSTFPVVVLWVETTGRAPRVDGLDLKRAETALIVRPRDEVEVRALPPAAAAFVGSLFAGASLSEAARAAEAFPDFDLATHLAGLFDAGLILDLASAPD